MLLSQDPQKSPLQQKKAPGALGRSPLSSTQPRSVGRPGGENIRCKALCVRKEDKVESEAGLRAEQTGTALICTRRQFSCGPAHKRAGPCQSCSPRGSTTFCTIKDPPINARWEIREEHGTPSPRTTPMFWHFDPDTSMNWDLPGRADIGISLHHACCKKPGALHLGISRARGSGSRAWLQGLALTRC